MQMLLPEHASHYNWHLDSRVLRGWMVESAIHGAAGITFWPWSFLGVDDRPGDRSTSIERVDEVGTTIRQLQASGIFEMLPAPTIAVLYQPYAEGWGNVSQVYGLLRYPSDEPIALFRELRFGTSCGQVEYLTPNTLDQARFEDYGVMLAPFSCDLTAQHGTAPALSVRCLAVDSGCRAAGAGASGPVRQSSGPRLRHLQQRLDVGGVDCNRPTPAKNPPRPVSTPCVPVPT
jgi:hypothetical protein